MQVRMHSNTENAGTMTYQLSMLLYVPHPLRLYLLLFHNRPGSTAGSFYTHIKFRAESDSDASFLLGPAPAVGSVQRASSSRANLPHNLMSVPRGRARRSGDLDQTKGGGLDSEENACGPILNLEKKKVTTFDGIFNTCRCKRCLSPKDGDRRSRCAAT